MWETSWEQAQVGKQICLLYPCWGESLCLPLQAAGGSHRWSHPSASQTWSYLFSQFLQLWVSATQAEIYNPATGGCSQVCTVPLSISKETSKSQNVKSFMFSTTKAEFSSLMPAWESQKFMLRTDLVCYPWFHLCRVQPAVISSGQITSKIMYHGIVPRSIYPAVRVIAFFRTKQRKRGFQ